MELLSVMLQIQHEALSTLGLAVAIGIAVFAAAFGIGKIGQSALEASPASRSRLLISAPP